MVDILGSIDDKIELNNTVIQNCDTILSQIFDLFYTRIKNNEQKTIGSLDVVVSDFVANGSFADLKKNVQILECPEYAYFIRNTDLKAQNFQRYVDEKTYGFLSKSALYGNEVLISNVGDVGSVFLCPKLDRAMTLGNNMIYITSTGAEYYNFYLYFLFLSDAGQYLIRGITGGSAQPKFNKTDFRNIQIPIPSKDELREFNDKIEPYLDRIDYIRRETTKLNGLKQLYLKKFFG